jgi:hypothetical protein
VSVSAVNKLSRSKAICFAIIFLTLLGASMVVYETRLELEPGLALEGILSDTQSQSIKITLDLTQLIMTWTLAVIGAAGFFLKLNIEKKDSLQRFDIALTFAIILVCVVSLYFGHLAVDRTASLLAVDQFPVGKTELRRMCQYQYLAFFASLLLFGFHVFQFFWPTASNRSAPSQSEGET